MAPEPTWQGIPIEVKEYFVGYLDYKTRCRLRVCSRGDRDLVDACPIAVEVVNLCLNTNQLEIMQGGASVKINHNIVDNFCKFFEHRDITVEIVNLFLDAAIDVVKDYFFSRIQTIRTIKTKNINLDTSEISEQDLRRLIPVIDSNHLKTMRVEPKMSPEAAEYLIGTECWKNLKAALWIWHQDIRVDAFLNMDIFRAPINNLTAVDTWSAIDKFINKETLKPIANGFVISYKHGPTEEQIVVEFKVAPKRVENPKHETDPSESKYKYHFQTKTDKLFLVVVLNKRRSGSHQLNGYICEEGQREMICFF